MSEDASEDFEGIVSNEEEGEDSDQYLEANLPNVWEAIEEVWPHVHKDEGMLIRGLVIVEVMNNDGEKELRFLRSDEMEPWDIYGFLKFASVDLSIEGIANMLIDLATIQSDEDEDEEEG